MFLFSRYHIKSYEIGLLFDKGEFRALLPAGRRWIFNPLWKKRVQVISLREPPLRHDQLDVMAKSGALEGRAVVVDLKDHQRGLVWIDGRFSEILPPGLFAYWTAFKDVQVEVVDARDVRFRHDQLKVIAATGSRLLELHTVDRGHVGVLFLDGEFVETLAPGQYAFWRGMAEVRVIPVDLRETMIDVSGQEIMTADKVTLRLNAVVTYRIADPRQAVSTVENVPQTLYRQAQLVLRAIVGGRDLDALLADKDALAGEAEAMLRQQAAELGAEISAVGVRDVILPGEMKDLLNKVTEAKKAAEANLIVRREETAAMRSQANTAKLLEANPTLMRLRELEVLEKVATAGQLNVVLGEKGLADRVVNLL